MVKLELTADNWPEMLTKLEQILGPQTTVLEIPEAEAEPEPEPKPKAKRKRRTKAEIEAEKKAAAEPAPEPEPEPEPESNVVQMPAEPSGEVNEDEIKARFKTLVTRNYDAAFTVLQSIECESFLDAVEKNKLADLAVSMAAAEEAFG